MARHNLSEIIAAAWEHTLKTSPDPMRNDWLAEHLGVIPRTTYRERLDKREINMYGEIIPRIERVRRHLRALGSLRLNPARLPK